MPIDIVLLWLTVNRRTYKPELDKFRKDRAATKQAAKQKELERALKDMSVEVPLGQSNRPQAKSVSKPARSEADEYRQKLRTGQLDEDDDTHEEQEIADDEEEDGETWAGENGEEIDREDHAMYQSLRQEQVRRSGVPAPRTRKSAFEDEAFGARWPAPS